MEAKNKKEIQILELKVKYKAKHFWGRLKKA